MKDLLILQVSPQQIEKATNTPEYMYNETNGYAH